MPCKEPQGAQRNAGNLYRSCTALLIIFQWYLRYPVTKHSFRTRRVGQHLALGRYDERCCYPYRLGYTDAAVDAAICSQVHNNEVYRLLSDYPDFVAEWLGGR